MQTALIQHNRVANERPTASVRQAIEALFRHKKWFLGCVSTVILITVAFIVFIPREYSSEMKILVKNARENVVVSAERTNPINVVNDVTEAQVNSELEILQSRDVLDPVADPGWEKTPEDHRTSYAIDQHEAALHKFTRKLTADVVRKTNLITVSFRARTPEQARNLLQALSEAYIAQHKKMSRPIGTSTFFATEAERYRQIWNDASGKLVAFQQQYQLNSLPIRKAQLEQQITSTESDLLVADATLREQEARMAEATKALRSMPTRQTTEDRAMPNLQSVQELNTLLVGLENRRTGLLINYKSDDRRVRDLDNQIASTRAALNQAAENRSHEVTTNVDPVWQQIRNDYSQARISKRAGTAHHAAMFAQLSTLKQQLGDMQKMSSEFDNLEEQVEQARNNYELFVQKRDQAQIEDAMDNQKLTNVAIAQEPTLSYTAVRPRPLLDVVLGIFSAIFLGLCVVYCAETGRNTIATPRELDSISRYPSLATVSAGLISTGSGAGSKLALEKRKGRTMIVHTTRPLSLHS